MIHAGYKNMETKRTHLANIHYNRVISSQMIFPVLVCYFFIWTATCILSFFVWLAFDTIQIFMKTIEKECEELLSILLGVAGELRRKSGQRILELAGNIAGADT